MANHHLLVLLLAVASTATLAAASGGGGNGTAPTAYEMLERYDFPRGILPVGVEGYRLGPGGAFEVFFPRDCEFLIARRYLVRYGRRVAGTARADALTGLSGVSVRVLFFWVGVGEVDRAGDRLSFRVGPISTSFPLSDFAESPHCRGFDRARRAAVAIS